MIYLLYISKVSDLIFKSKRIRNFFFTLKPNNIPNFKGLNFYPKGQSTIDDSGPDLIVSNISNSSLDGVSIETGGARDFEVTFNDIPIGRAMAIGASYNQVDNLGRLKTVGQIALARVQMV